ncbi:MAG: type II toxin-antitoxin system VapC family toxin [Anaerolineaceae bacterium]|nr:type II toxin-antitoxin system VapC family toxin [Anaerolineaceae bacterium]
MNNKQPVYVLDSFAFLAYLEDESGKSTVVYVLDDAQEGKCRVLLSVINLGEVICIVERERGVNEAREVLAAIDQLPIDILPAPRDAVLAAAHIKANYRVSYADAFAVGAAQEHQGVIITGDPEFKAVESLITVNWLTGK